MANNLKNHYVEFDGGIEERYSNVKQNPGQLLTGINVETRTEGGYRRLLGYNNFDNAEIAGQGPIRGVWKYNGKVYAVRDNVGGVGAKMWHSTGTGWAVTTSILTEGGSYEFINEDFAGTQKMYYVNGVDTAHEWDGAITTAITTGMATDTPNHLIAFKKHLFLSFGRSVQNSPIGDPTGIWTVVTGANEMALGDTVTTFERMTGGVLGIFSRDRTNILRGSSAADFVNDNLSEHGLKIGAIAGTMQQMGSRLYYLDDRGVVDFYTSQNFGDFDDATISYPINKFLATKASGATASCVVRNKTQYRLFFDDGTGILISLSGNNVKGITRTAFKDSAGAALPVRCTANVEDADGNELILFGSDDGFVRVMESGNTFDGVAMEAFLRTQYTHANQPRMEKQWEAAVLDLRSTGITTVQAYADYQFHKPDGQYLDIDISGSDSILGSGILGQAILGSAPIHEGRIWMPGHSEYVNMTLYSNADEPPWEVAGIMYNYLPGRKLI